MAPNDSKPNTNVSKPNTSTSKPNASTSKPNTGASKPNNNTSKPNQAKSKPEEEPPKATTKNMICNPTRKAYVIDATKARLRAMNTRDPENFYWKQNYGRHIQALEEIKPMIDMKSPTCYKDHYIKPTPYHRAILRERKTEIGNGQLLRNLAAIYTGELKTGLDTKLADQPVEVKNQTRIRLRRAMQIERENKYKFDCLQRIKPSYSRIAMRDWYAEQQTYLDRIARYPPDAWKICPKPLQKIMEKSYGKPRQYAYLLVEAEDKEAENIVIELYADLCPFTVKNFQRLCTNTKATSCDCRTYRCKKFDHLHSVQLLDGSFKKLYWVVGEHVDSTVEYSEMMIKESSKISHSEAGLVTKPKNRTGGAFFITADSCPHLDKFCYVFGKVDGKGLSFLKRMEEKNTEENGQIILSMHITDCGVVGDPDDVPPPMLLHDFISQARMEILPFIKRNPNEPAEWLPQKSKFVEHLTDRAEEGGKKHEQYDLEARTIAEVDYA